MEMPPPLKNRIYRAEGVRSEYWDPFCTKVNLPSQTPPSMTPSSPDRIIVPNSTHIRICSQTVGLSHSSIPGLPCKVPLAWRAKRDYIGCISGAKPCRRQIIGRRKGIDGWVDIGRRIGRCFFFLSGGPRASLELSRH